MVDNEGIRGVWFPTVRTGTGTDVFTERLAEALERRGIRAGITWLPKRAEFLPWLTRARTPPSWANVVHVNSWLHGRFVPPELPVVVTVHSFVHDPMLARYKNFPRRFYHQYWIRRCETAAVHRADAVTAVSHYVSRQAKALFRRDGIIAVYNWIDDNVFAAPPDRTPHNPFRVLFVGNTQKPLKGADLLRPIMERLGPGYELWYTGDPGEIILKNGVALGYLGSAEALVHAYTQCDVLVLPSRLEGFGLVALEAQACGLPVVATDCTALPEIVMHERTGLLCSIDDVDAFVDAIRRLRSDQTLWHEMSRSAVARTTKVFSEQQAVERYISVYRDVLKGKRANTSAFNR